MTIDGFASILRKENVNFQEIRHSRIMIDGTIVVMDGNAYIEPCGDKEFNTSSCNCTSLKHLKPEDLKPMIAHYRKTVKHNHAALKILSRFVLTRDGILKYSNDDGRTIYGKDAVAAFKRDMKPIL